MQFRLLVCVSSLASHIRVSVCLSECSLAHVSLSATQQQQQQRSGSSATWIDATVAWRRNFSAGRKPFATAAYGGQRALPAPTGGAPSVPFCAVLARSDECRLFFYLLAEKDNFSPLTNIYIYIYKYTSTHLYIYIYISLDYILLLQIIDPGYLN